jgi:diguanylate cyclase (GGDEF)-like protein
VGEVTVKMWEMPVLLNSFSLVILLIFFLDNQQRHLENKSQKYFFFQTLVVSNFLLLVLDGVTWLVTGTPDPTLRSVNIAASTFYYILTPLPSFFFLRFTDVVMNVAAEKQKKQMRWYAVPVAINFVLAGVSPYTGWFFRIDSANVYHRGSLLPLSFLLSFVLLFVALYKAVRRYTAAHKEPGALSRSVKEYQWIFEYACIPIVGGVVQVFFYNVTYVWNFMVIGLLILYINYQNAEITTDTLTGLYNRRQSFAYFERFMRERTREKLDIAVVMIDINNFKLINDRCGHTLGDEAIIAVARVLEDEFKWDDFICRFGGDEYVIITKHGDLKTLNATLQAVNEHLLALQREGRFEYELSVSAGYAQYSRKGKTLDALIKQADDMMFEQKAKLLRRATDKQSGGPKT